VQEVQAAEDDVRAFLASEVGHFLSARTFTDAPASARVLRATVAELEDGYADTSRNSGLFAARRSNVQVDSAPSLRPDSPIT